MKLQDLIPYFKEETDDKFDFRFTVFTPVFNGAKTIERVYQSLQKQTYTNFEWLIINDGSTDDSAEVIHNLLQNSNLNARFINNQNNQHKMACFIEAISLAKGQFLLPLDADDECSADALEIFDMEYKTIPKNLKSKIVAITALCKDENGNLVGHQFPSDPYYSNTFETNAINKLKGEKWGFNKTNILRGIAFNPEFINNGFMSEGIIWNILASEGYQTKYINKVLRIYHTEVPDSISKSANEKVANGRIVQFIVNFNQFFSKYFHRATLYFFKNMYFMLAYSNFSHFKLKDYFKNLSNPIIKISFVLLWPFRKLMKP